MTQDKNEGHKNFTQCPNSIIDGYPELAIYDKWVLLTLMRVCWDRGPHKISLRSISSLSGVPSSLLCSTSPNAKKPKEGILDRLERFGLIKVESCRPVNSVTGAKGRAQTYLYVEHEKVWSHNTEFFTSNKSIEPNMYLAKEEFEIVRQTNSNKEPSSVRQENSNVRQTNTINRLTNNKDLQTNNNVRSTSSNVTPKTIKITNTLEDKEDSVTSLSTDKERDLSLFVSHPNHDFIWFDDLMAPSLMIIKLTPSFPHPHYSEQEDKQRERIALWEVKPYLEQRGLNISIQWQHEAEQETIEAGQGIPNANTESPTTGNRPDTLTASGIQHHNSNDVINHSNGINGMENVKKLEEIRTNDAKSPIVSETTTKNGVDALATGKDQQGLIDPAPSEEQQQDPSQETLWNNENPAPIGEKPKESNKGKGRNKKKQDMANEPVVMPGDDAPWTNETIVQIHEARLGRRYPNGAKRKSDRIRDNELEAAQALIEMNDIWTDSTAENCRRLLKIIEHLETRQNQWWLNTNGHVMPHQLVDKDRIHQMVDELKRLKEEQKHNMQKLSSPTKQISQRGTGSALSFAPEELRQIARVPQEERKAYIEKLKAEKEQAKMANYA